MLTCLFVVSVPFLFPSKRHLLSKRVCLLFPFRYPSAPSCFRMAASSPEKWKTFWTPSGSFPETLRALSRSRKLSGKPSGSFRKFSVSLPEVSGSFLEAFLKFPEVFWKPSGTFRSFLGTFRERQFDLKSNRKPCSIKAFNGHSVSFRQAFRYPSIPCRYPRENSTP